VRSAHALAALIVFAACVSSKPDAIGPEPPHDVSLEAWCRELTPVVCDKIGSCVGSKDVATGCAETGIPSCIAGRDGARSSGHDSAELAQCASVFRSTPCEPDYAGAIATHTECQAAPPE
jgi:hypothetical protein